ncbi:MAG TPA: polyphosphate kinase 2 family protein [Verrucomicrobiae bacterium]|nr:polyphosphate kinase 2 family protein [Verrucomicrobiae bacterium]
MNRKDLAKAYWVENGKKFRLDDVDPADTCKIKSKEEAHEWLERGIRRLSELQSLLYAQNKWALLLIFQAMDAAGKDGTIKHVMSGVNPQGCEVFSFKAPSEEELNHDYLWRSAKCLPQRGRIGIFNRSYYEEVLVVRVHQDLLEGQKLPASLVTKDIWAQRYEDISNFENYLSRNGILIRKFFLHLSKKEQKRRLLSRLDEPDKNWKFSVADLREREHWKDYMDAYDKMIRHTSSEAAPWYVVPADHKWFTRLVVAEVVVDALESLKLTYPEVDEKKRKELAAVRKTLAGHHGE